jgi:hypothetical protein
VFKLTFAMMLLLGAFLCGYYAGHQSDSPDIFGMAGRACGQGSEACDSLRGLLDGDQAQTLQAVGKDGRADENGIAGLLGLTGKDKNKRSR